jgi:hypothetical protein
VTNVTLVPPGGVNVCEIEDHPFQEQAIAPEALSELIETHTVDSPPRGKLVRRKAELVLGQSLHCCRDVRVVRQAVRLEGALLSLGLGLDQRASSS